MEVVVRNARLRDVGPVKRLADAHRRELGFTVRPIIEASQRDRELLVARVDGKFAGFLRWHPRRDGWNTVYEVCVDPQYRRRGVARLLLYAIPRPTRLKCPTDNPANTFYQKAGFRRTGRENGRKRTLNIWVRRR